MLAARRLGFSPKPHRLAKLPKAFREAFAVPMT